MRQAIRLLDTLSAELKDHELYRWITSTHHADARRHYDCFVPALTFIMTFPYYNERYLSYGADTDGDDRPEVAALRTLIDEHAREDRTHSRLFLHDVRRLKLEQVWGLSKPSTLLWTLWLSPMLDPVRAIQSDRIKAVVDPRDGWAPYRYLHVEEIERDGNLIFTAAARKAVDVEAQTGERAVYFGGHHLQRESGHVGDSEFQDIELSAVQAAHAQRIVEHKSALSAALTDQLLQHAQAAESVAAPGVLLAREQEAHLAELRAQVAAHLAGQLPAQPWHIRTVESPDQQALYAAWDRHYRSLSSHPFVALFQNARGPETAFVLRSTAMLFAMRICSLHTFYAHDGRIKEPAAGPGSDIVGFIRDTFATEAEIFFHDWDVLAMDRLIPWNMAELLEWWFLHEKYGRPELEALHEFRRQALMAHDDPMMTYWAFMAIHFIAKVFFENSAALAERFEKAYPELPPLMYFKGTHHLLYDRVSTVWKNPPHPTSLGHLPVTADQSRRILHMLDVFARYSLRQFDNLVTVLTTDRAQLAFLDPTQS